MVLVRGKMTANRVRTSYCVTNRYLAGTSAWRVYVWGRRNVAVIRIVAFRSVGMPYVHDLTFGWLFWSLV